MSAREAVDPFLGREQQDVLRIRLRDGSRVEGSYLTQAGMHFLHVRDGSATGRVEGPVSPADVASLTVVRSRREVLDERFDRQRGEIVPGTCVRTRDGYRARLERLAGVAARADGVMRRMQVERQFDDVADEIALARTKRKWILAEARWRLHSNEAVDKLALSGGDMTTAERFQRPRDQDFDPDPAERRRRRVLPHRVASDPRSPQNMLRALRAAGFKARVSVLSEMTDDGVDLLVDFPGGKFSGRFSVEGRRGSSGDMDWRIRWEGGQTKTAMTRRSRALRSEDHARLQSAVADGYAGALPDPDEGPAPGP